MASCELATGSLGDKFSLTSLLLFHFHTGVQIVTMETQCWGQVTTVDPACVPMVQGACDSLQEAVTVVKTPSRPSVSATQDTEV